MNKSDAAFDAFVDDCFVEGDPICDTKADKTKPLAPELKHLKSIQDYWNAESEAA